VYWFFVMARFCSSPLHSFELIPFKTNVVLTNYCILVAFINFIRHIAVLNTKDKFRFTNEIVNKGNSLTIATNIKGEVSFCSETVTEILGYQPEEMLGMGFWILTEDPELVNNTTRNL
jgi:PAS domain-containing protein